MSKFYVALVHYPVYDKNGKIVTTAVTNVDVHDIARSSVTYGVDGYFLVTPVEQQRALVTELLEHWKDGPGATYNKRRSQAISFVRVVADLSEAMRVVESETGQRPITVGTGASLDERTVTHQKMREILAEASSPVLLLFGTGWGLEKRFVDSMDYLLKPIRGKVTYNHLSVRSAAAIMLDRLLGRGLDDI